MQLAYTKIGTATWNYPGWRGIVYPANSPEKLSSAERLAMYARSGRFETVEADFTFYRPQNAREWKRYAASLPAGFPVVSKVWEELTCERFPKIERQGDRGGKDNPNFLNVEAFKTFVLGPAEEGFDHLGPFVFEFRRECSPTPESRAKFRGKLDAFLSALPRGHRYAVEIRTAEYLDAEYLAMLRSHGAAHVLNLWTYMPPLSRQFEVPGLSEADFLISRILVAPWPRVCGRREDVHAIRQDPGCPPGDARRRGEDRPVRGREEEGLLPDRQQPRGGERSVHDQRDPKDARPGAAAAPGAGKRTTRRCRSEATANCHSRERGNRSRRTPPRRSTSPTAAAVPPLQHLEREQLCFRARIRDMRKVGLVVARIVAWGWFLLAGVGGLMLLIHEGPLPVTNGWFAMFSGIAACPGTAWLLKRYFRVNVPLGAQFAVAFLIWVAGRAAVAVVLHRSFWPHT